MTLRLNGTTSGYVEIDSAATSGNHTIVLPSSNGTANQFLKNGTTAGTLGWSSLVETADGQCWIGTTTGVINASNFGIVFSPSGVLAVSRNVTTSGVVQFFGSAGEFRTLGNGNAQNTNNSYGAISDSKLKENIVDAGSQWNDVKGLRVRKYNLKKETGYNTHTQIGLIAQEAELVSPGIVGEYIDEKTGDSTKTVDYSVLYMKAVKALQEAMERIETLEAANAAIETRLAALEAQQ